MTAKWRLAKELTLAHIYLMITVVGVDPAGRYLQGLRLLDRLRLPGAQAHLVTVVEPLLPMPSPFTPGFLPPFSECLGDRMKAGSELLDSAEKEVPRWISVAGKHVGYGNPAQELLHYSQYLKADLIVVGTTNVGPVSSMFLGSVSKTLLAHAQCSTLFAKQPSYGPVTAVLATDHSDYMSQCIRRLAETSLTGFERLVVLTVNLFDDVHAANLLSAMPALASGANAWVRARLREKNVEAAHELEKLGIDCESRIETGDVSQAIARVMQETGAELLILGAQGHSFVERLRTGSTSFNEVLMSEHSVLLLRPAKPN